MAETSPVVVVTGATDGIGRATALALAARGAHVIVHGRNQVRVGQAVDAIAAQVPKAKLDGISFDLGSMAAVRSGAASLLARFPRIDVLINNAGIFASERVITGDGFELTLAVNYLAAHLLTHLLTDALSANSGTVINVSSIAHTRGRIDLDDLSLTTGFTGYSAYAQSKLAQVLDTVSFAERHDPSRIRAYALHPGVIGTKLLREGFGPVRGGTAEQGARTQLMIVASIHQLADAPGVPLTARFDPEDLPSGAYLSDGIVTPPSSMVRDVELRQQLWQWTERALSITQ